MKIGSGRGGLGRNFSSKRLAKQQSKRGSAKESMNIFCSSGLVSRNFILEKIKDVKKNRKVTQLEVEDLITSFENSSLIPSVKALLLQDDRNWKYIKFVDTIELEDFSVWQNKTEKIMHDYEDSIKDASKYQSCVRFQGNVEIRAGATKSSVFAFLKGFQEQKTIQSLGFGGALFATAQERLPEALNDLFDNDCILAERIVVNVDFGWLIVGGSQRGASGHVKKKSYWRETLHLCLNKLQGIEEETVDSSMVDGSHNGKAAHRRQPILNSDSARFSVRRTKSMGQEGLRSMSPGLSRPSFGRSRSATQEDNAAIGRFRKSARKLSPRPSGASVGRGQMRRAKSMNDRAARRVASISSSNGPMAGAKGAGFPDPPKGSIKPNLEEEEEQQVKECAIIRRAKKPARRLSPLPRASRARRTKSMDELPPNSTFESTASDDDGPKARSSCPSNFPSLRRCKTEEQGSAVGVGSETSPVASSMTADLETCTKPGSNSSDLKWWSDHPSSQSAHVVASASTRTTGRIALKRSKSAGHADGGVSVRHKEIDKGPDFDWSNSDSAMRYDWTKGTYVGGGISGGVPSAA